VLEVRGWWIVLDAVCWIFIAIALGMGAFGEWPPTPYDVILVAALAIALIWSLWAWRSVRVSRRPPDAGRS
jgi:membrane protein implicated in regulation of membrane protease activity